MNFLSSAVRSYCSWWLFSQLTLAWMSAAAVPPQEPMRAAVDDVLGAAQTGSQEEIRRVVERFRKPEELSASAWWRVGRTLYERGFYREAWSCFNNMAWVAPDDGRSRAMQGMCEYHLREYEQALIHLQQGRTQGWEDDEVLRREARLTAGLLLNRMGEFEAAFETLRRFAEGDWVVEDVFLGLGLSFLQLAYLPSEIPPESRPVVRLAGDAVWAATNFSYHLADALFQQLVRKYPRHPGVHYAYGVYLMRDRKDQGLREFLAELEVDPRHVPSLLQLAFEHMVRSEYEEALEYARRAAAVDPSSYRVQYAIGLALLEQGETAMAIAALEKSVAVAPEVPEPHLALARAYQKVGRLADAAREREAFRRYSNRDQEIKKKVQ